MESVQDEAPPSLSAKYEGSFAYLTVRDRMPTILTRVIDTIHRSKNHFFEAHGEEGVEAEKRAISLLSQLKSELQTDKPIRPLMDQAEDTDAWNRYTQRQQGLMDPGRPASWFGSPWLYVECYMYRKIQEALWLSPPIGDFDVFEEAKTKAYSDSQGAITSLCTYLTETLTSLGGSNEEQLKGHFLTFLQISLWGNRCDLSISACGDAPRVASPVEALPELHRLILVDDSERVWSALTSASGGGARVDVVLDNVGPELMGDLALADFLVSSGLAAEVRFHGKSMPWFVSDATERDFHRAAARGPCAARWGRHLQAGAWSYCRHAFWTLPHEFHHMATEAPDLYAALRASDLLLFKGDLNYRRLTGDRMWDHTAPFQDVLRGFRPAPLCSLRTLKADVQVGLEPGRAEELTAQEGDWMTSGRYAVLQFSAPSGEP